MNYCDYEFERWRAASATYRNFKPLKAVDRIWLGVVGRFQAMFSTTRLFLKAAAKIERIEREFEFLSDAELQDKIRYYRELFRRRRQSHADTVQALALIGAACHKVKGIVPYRVQYAGVLAMQSNSLIEMATGEGKSLVAALAGILCGWYGQGCHVITVNDYLAERDALQMRELYEYCGCTVGFIGGDAESEERLQAYQCDVTYCTEREVVADYLRDNLRLQESKTLVQKMLLSGDNNRLSANMLQRGLVCAIVDEADSVLIDRAITPLIISQEVEGIFSAEIYKECSHLASTLVLERDYRIDRQYKSVVLLQSGMNFVKENSAGSIRGRIFEDLLIQALQAQHFYHLDHDYIIDEEKIVLVDNSTGRLMRDHSWRGGIQQAVEAKEGVEISLPKETISRISFQRFFRMYENMSGMTGTAKETASEILEEYGLKVISVPSRKKCLRVFRPVKILPSKAEKWQAVFADARAEHDKGRPVLIGTRHIEDSAYLGELFRTYDLPCQVLNAVNHYEEAEIIQHAGQKGIITIATNMAGRGTDIKLGEGINELGGLHVIATEFHSSSRVDRQLYGRCSRQGNKGSVSIIVSWEDELPEIFLPYVTRVMRCVQRGIVCLENTDKKEDSSILRYLLGLSVLPLRLLLPGSRGFLAGRVSLLLFRFAQSKAERFLRKQRRASFEQDYNLSESLAFSGESTG